MSGTPRVPSSIVFTVCVTIGCTTRGRKSSFASGRTDGVGSVVVSLFSKQFDCPTGNIAPIPIVGRTLSGKDPESFTVWRADGCGRVALYGTNSIIAPFLLDHFAEGEFRLNLDADFSVFCDRYGSLLGVYASPLFIAHKSSKDMDYLLDSSWHQPWEMVPVFEPGGALQTLIDDAENSPGSDFVWFRWINEMPNYSVFCSRVVKGDVVLMYECVLIHPPAASLALDMCR